MNRAELHEGQKVVVYGGYRHVSLHGVVTKVAKVNVTISYQWSNGSPVEQMFRIDDQIEGTDRRNSNYAMRFRTLDQQAAVDREQAAHDGLHAMGVRNPYEVIKTIGLLQAEAVVKLIKEWPDASA